MTFVGERPKQGARPRRSREHNRQRNRQRILDASIEIFARKGFDGASILEIAERSGLGRESLYKVFQAGAQPRYETIDRIAKAMGVELRFVAR